MEQVFVLEMPGSACIGLIDACQVGAGGFLDQHFDYLAMPSGWLRQVQGRDIVSEEEEKARRWMVTLYPPVWQPSEAGGPSLQRTGPAAHQGGDR